uniref:P-type ATPase C-terminal domain-containing protein n=1 Tax=Hucho hucho TaxID=62062 RepID=A0A4W5Q993_9TELE
MSLAGLCQSVLCCHVTSGQKADVVMLIGKQTTSITMAIGDDANLIKRVGLAGVEGGQTVQNADFALPQFSFLQRLLLVHRSWLYRRIAVFFQYKSNQTLFVTCAEYNREMLTYKPLTNSAVQERVKKILTK